MESLTNTSDLIWPQAQLADCELHVYAHTSLSHLRLSNIKPALHLILQIKQTFWMSFFHV